MSNLRGRVEALERARGPGVDPVQARERIDKRLDAMRKRLGSPDLTPEEVEEVHEAGREYLRRLRR